MKVQIKGYTSDRSYFDVWNDEMEIPVEGDIKDALVYILKEREFTDDDIKDVLHLLETKEWNGGQWIRESDVEIFFITDVTEEHFILK